LPAAIASVSAAIWTTVTLAGLAAAVLLLVRATRARRPGLAVTAPLAVAAAVRVAAAVAVTVIPGLSSVRGPDEAGYVLKAHRVVDHIDALGSLPGAILHNLHIYLIAGQEAVMGRGAGIFPMRMAEIGIAVAAIAIVAVAVNDLAGPRAGLIAAWILALEPGGVFFSGLLLKEALVFLGESLIILGCVRMYTRRDAAALMLMAPGLAIVVASRPYVGVALGFACIAVSIHAALRHPPGRARMLTLGVACAALAIGGTISLIEIDSIGDRLQVSQNANTSDRSNLKLEPVDFTSADGAAEAAGRRTIDLLLRPYPWQVSNTSQRLGVLGSAFAWLLLFLTVFLVLRRPREALPRLAPLLYVAVATTLGYAIATGNAGTGFRYRTHLLVALAACVSVLVVRDNRLRSADAGPHEIPAPSAARSAVNVR
jgi:hypothetical protein